MVRLAGRTERASVAGNGAQSNGSSGQSEFILLAISADGKFVAFQSDASNLVPGDTNGMSDVFVHEVAVSAAPASFSLGLNGTAAYAEAAPSLDLNLTGDWTVEAWFKDEDPNGFNHDNRTILSKGDTSSNPEVPYLVQLGRSNIITGVRTGGHNYLLTFDLAYLGLRPTDWHHVAVTFSASLNVLNLWLDGQHLTYLQIPAHTAVGNASPLDLGRKGPTTGAYWLGKLDDVRIWNIARKGSDITNSFRGELTSPQPGLVANWKFNDGGSTSASDSTGGHTATLLGGADFSTNVHP